MNPRAILPFLCLASLGSPTFLVATTSFTPSFVGSATQIAGPAGEGLATTLVAPTFRGAVLGGGTIESVSGSAVTDPGALGATTVVPEGNLLLELTNGANAGRFFSILSVNLAESTYNLSSSAEGVAEAGNTYRIVEAVSIGAWLGETNPGELESSASPTQADQVYRYAPGTGMTSLYFYYVDGEESYWSDASLDPAGATPILPGEGVIVRRIGIGNKTIYSSGFTPDAALKVPVTSGYNLISPNEADPNQTLSGLGLEPIIRSADDPKDADLLILVAADGTSRSFFHSDSPDFGGWYSLDFVSADDQSLPAGAALFLLRAENADPAIWNQPLP